MRLRRVLWLVLLVAFDGNAQSGGGWGRVSLFGQAIRSTRDDGFSASFSELTAALTLRSASAEEGGIEYAVDLRGVSSSSASGRDRFALYDAWVGGFTKGGRFGARVGQLWVNDLGALGSLGGVLLEARPTTTPLGRLRLGVFGGLEPKGFEAGYVTDVRKGGGFVALDGDGARRHVLGYVLLKDSGMTERSVLTLVNYVPSGTSFFLYQTAEYDLTGPGGVGSGGLTYLFASARYSPVKKVDLSVTFHRGRSIDSRTITLDQLNGRPIDPRALEGFLFESAGGRVSVEVLPSIRLQVGYAQDRSNRDDVTSGRLTVGIHAANLFHSGLDLTLTDNRTSRDSQTYDAWYASLGRSLGPRVYLSLDYSTSLSVFRFTDVGGLVVESRPRTKRYGLSGSVNLGRAFSVLLTAEQLRDDDSREERGLAGLTYRF